MAQATRTFKLNDNSVVNYTVTARNGQEVIIAAIKAQTDETDYQRGFFKECVIDAGTVQIIPELVDRDLLSRLYRSVTGFDFGFPLDIELENGETLEGQALGYDDVFKRVVFGSREFQQAIFPDSARLTLDLLVDLIEEARAGA